jgi:hypothetical protein
MVAADGRGQKVKGRFLYRLPEVLEVPIVFVVEGERDVETLREHGFVATTNAGGAKSHWAPQYTDWGPFPGLPHFPESVGAGEHQCSTRRAGTGHAVPLHGTGAVAGAARDCARLSVDEKTSTSASFAWR